EGEELLLISLVVRHVAVSRPDGARAAEGRWQGCVLSLADEAPPLRDGRALHVVLAQIPAVGIAGRLQRSDDGDLIRVIKLQRRRGRALAAGAGAISVYSHAEHLSQIHQLVHLP